MAFPKSTFKPGVVLSLGATRALARYGSFRKARAARYAYIRKPVWAYNAALAAAGFPVGGLPGGWLAYCPRYSLVGVGWLARPGNPNGRACW